MQAGFVSMQHVYYCMPLFLPFMHVACAHHMYTHTHTRMLAWHVHATPTSNTNEQGQTHRFFDSDQSATVTEEEVGRVEETGVSNADSYTGRTDTYTGRTDTYTGRTDPPQTGSNTRTSFTSNSLPRMKVSLHSVS